MAIQKAENAMKECEVKLARAYEKIDKLEEKQAQIKDEWETNLIECLGKCTFKIKGGHINADPDPRKAHFGAAAIHLDSALMKVEGGYGAQLS